MQRESRLILRKIEAPTLGLQVVLKSLLDCALAALEHCIKSSLTQRSFESFFPRLTVRSAITPGWEGGEEAVSNAIVSLLFSELKDQLK